MKVSATIDDETVRGFLTDGFAHISGAIEPASLERVRQLVDQRIASKQCIPINPSEPGYLFDEQLWCTDPALEAIATKPHIVAAVGQLLRTSTLTFLGDQVLVKEPRSEASTLWHQDRNYWAFSGQQLASAWIPLDDVPARRSLKLVPGSHLAKNSIAPRHFGTALPHVDIGSDEWDTRPDEADLERRAVSFSVRAGDAIVFHAATIHGAGGNTAVRDRRRVYVTRWAGDDIRFRPRSGDIALPKNAEDFREGDKIEGPLFPRFNLETQ